MDELVEPGNAKLTAYALDRLMEGRLSRWIRRIAVKRDVASGVLLGSVAIRVTQIEEGKAKVDLLLLEADTGKTLIEFAGLWVEPGGKLTFEGNDQVLIAARMAIR